MEMEQMSHPNLIHQNNTNILLWIAFEILTCDWHID
jgi:hypothetical protein